MVHGRNYETTSKLTCYSAKTIDSSLSRHDVQLTTGACHTSTQDIGFYNRFNQLLLMCFYSASA